MKLLFLRGQVPCDRPLKQVMFDRLSDNDDMWILLAHQMLVETNGTGEVWYEKATRVVQYDKHLTERWVARYAQTACSFKPDIVFARGGFPFMLAEARRHPMAFKIHYGAGKRVVPPIGQLWDLVLVDTPKQLRNARSRGYNAQMFIKPAADHIFKPEKAEKKYDVIYCANFNPNTNKGHRFLLPALKGHSVLHVGISRGGWRRKYPNMTLAGWVPRRELPGLYAQARCAVVMTVGKDSCPRVVPEALACGCPVLVSETTKVSSSYVNQDTGWWFSKADFSRKLAIALLTYRELDPRSYYLENLSLVKAARLILGMING